MADSETRIADGRRMLERSESVPRDDALLLAVQSCAVFLGVIADTLAKGAVWVKDADRV